MRAILFLLFVILVFLIFRFTLNRIIEIRDRQNAANATRNDEADNEMSEDGEDAHKQMVRCAYCGVHLPQSEAYYDGKDTFCSEGHMQAFHEEENSKS